MKIIKYIFSLVVLSALIMSWVNYPIASSPSANSIYTGIPYNLNSSISLLVHSYQGTYEYEMLDFKKTKPQSPDSLLKYHESQKAFFESLYANTKNLIPNDIHPPNCVYIKDSLWIDESVISNIAYLEFLNQIAQDSSIEYYNAQIPPISLETKSTFNLFKEMGVEKENLASYDTKEYLSHPSFRFFPIVGLSYLQALEFCKWRSRITTEYYNTNTPHADYVVSFNFRLPTESEWEFIASSGLDEHRFPFGIIDHNELYRPLKINIKSASLISETQLKNYSSEEVLKKIKEQNKSSKKVCIINSKSRNVDILNSRFPLHAITEPKNEFGVYGMLGNVCEMISEPGISKGGSWLLPIEQCTVGSRYLYKDAAKMVGFRCVCEISYARK